MFTTLPPSIWKCLNTAALAVNWYVPVTNPLKQTPGVVKTVFMKVETLPVPIMLMFEAVNFNPSKVAASRPTP